MFRQSLALSAVRCTLTYIVFPFILPIVGITTGLNSTVGSVLTAIAVAANGLSIRRLWLVDHKYKLLGSIVNLAIIVLLLVLVARDANVLSV